MERECLKFLNTIVIFNLIIYLIGRNFNICLELQSSQTTFEMDTPKVSNTF